MRMLVYLMLFLGLVPSVNGQRVKFSGSIYDPNGAVLIAAKIAATREKSGQLYSATSNDAGEFGLELEPGLYSIEVSKTGFLSVQYPEYLIVNSPSGMKMDFVVFGAKWHEPCGYAGTDCLPKRQLIKDFRVKFSPTLKQLRDDFTDQKKKEK